MNVLWCILFYSFTHFFIKNINNITHKSIQNVCLLTFADGLIELLKSKSYLNNSYYELYPNCPLINDKILNNFVEYNVNGR